jgi:hypothetical protein
MGGRAPNPSTWVLNSYTNYAVGIQYINNNTNNTTTSTTGTDVAQRWLMSMSGERFAGRPRLVADLKISQLGPGYKRGAYSPCQRLKMQ